MMKQGLILMFILSLLGHIAAAGMLYVAGAYGMWDKHLRDSMDDQRGDAVKVLWGFVEETHMPLRGTKEDENVIPAQAGIQNAGRGLDSHFRGNDGHVEAFSSETPMSRSPVAHHDWRADDAQESVAPAELVSHHDPEADNAGLYGRPIAEDKSSRDEETMRSLGLYGYHPDPPAEADTRSAGLYDRHSDAEADGLVPSTPSTLSAGTGGDCSRSAACMGADTAVSEVYPGPGIDGAGSRGRGGQGEGLKTFLETLRVEIERHKNYPPFARKNGIEGTAYLNFHIGDDGKPGGIALERSSGSKILDESAIRTLKGMERFYPVPEEIRELEITVPIAYRLMEDTEKVNGQ